jgi:fructose-1-phosphate kinase PfkB-like protein
LIVIGGSIPPGFVAADILKIAQIARRHKIPVVIDSPGAVMKDLLSARPLLIKPNLLEFQLLVNRKVVSLAEVLKQAQNLTKTIPYVCISSVAGGTLLVTSQDSYFGKIPTVKIRSTVGAGDSMVGAMCGQLFKRNESPEDLLRWGLAASAATLSETGTSLGRAAEIRRLYKITRVRRI